MKIEQKLSFQRAYKKLHAKQQIEVDNAIREIMSDPKIGDLKKGDLANVYVYKFGVAKQLTLLAYTYNDPTTTLTLLALGSHENFYRDLKRP